MELQQSTVLKDMSSKQVAKENLMNMEEAESETDARLNIDTDKEPRSAPSKTTNKQKLEDIAQQTNENKQNKTPKLKTKRVTKNDTNILHRFR